MPNHRPAPPAELNWTVAAATGGWKGLKAGADSGILQAAGASFEAQGSGMGWALAGQGGAQRAGWPPRRHRDQESGRAQNPIWGTAFWSLRALIVFEV